MELQDVSARGIRFSVIRDSIEVGHAYLYLLHNDLHTEPFALLEDVAVHKEYQGQGIGNELVQAVIAHAVAAESYKLIATSRNNGTRTLVHEWYERLGFAHYGVEFRMNF